MSELNGPAPPGRLISHFTRRPREQQAEGWDSLWQSGENDLWDRGRPSPALIELLESRTDVLPAALKGRRSRALVPGCGRGYDVAMLALHGFEAIGLEVSAKGAETAREYAARELKSPQAYNFQDQSAGPAANPGSVTIIEGDFFAREWQDALVRDGVESFDLIYDYTFLCALLPEMRQDWCRRIRNLIAPTGSLVCLEFPMYKDLRAAGPPWGLRGVHWNLLAEGKDGIIHEAAEVKGLADGPFERIL